MEIDIRKEDIQEIDKIIFAEFIKNDNAMVLKKVKKVWILSEMNEVSIESKQDAQNLIKALQKAIELNWWQDSQ